MSTNPTRSVRIGEDERGGWSSERPLRPGETARPPREPDVSVRGRVLKPSDRLRYSPGSLLLIASADRAALARFTARVIEEQGVLFSMDKVRDLLKGKVPDDAIDAKSRELLDAAVAKRLAAGHSVAIALETLDAEERKPYIKVAHANKRPRHLLFLEVAKDEVPEEARDAVNELRVALDSGQLGAEGFATSLRLGGRGVEELKKIVFRPLASDD